MAIKQISVKEFDSFRPVRGPMVGTLIQEREWFAEDGGVVIGAVTYDASDEDWGYVVLGRDQAGQFRGIDIEVSMDSAEKAKKALLAKMQQRIDSNKKAFRSSLERRPGNVGGSPLGDSTRIGKTAALPQTTPRRSR